MKEPTTECSKHTQSTTQINREFLISQGWVLEDERPLHESFYHSKDKNVICLIGMYGGFSIHKLHWCNKTKEDGFSGTLTKSDDYFIILKLLKLTKLIEK